MKKFLKSLFGGGGDEAKDAPDREEAVASTDASAAAPASTPGAPAPDAPVAAAPAPAARGLSADEIAADLVAQICSTMPDPRPAEEIDLHVHMYDAGYVTSITAADLLAHIESRYGVDIAETKLIGPLQNLDALAKHIHEATA